MPIEGLTDEKSLAPRYPFLGLLRKGAPKGQKGPGKDLEYFRFVARPGPGAEQIEADFQKIYGDKPNDIAVYLPFPDLRCFSTWREMHGQNRLLKLRCDGRDWRYWLEGWQARHGKKPCTFEYCDPDNRCPDCPAAYVGRLSVILEPMWKKGHAGLVTVLTHGINDIAYIAGILTANIPLVGKEFRIYREPQIVGAPLRKDNKRIAVEKWMVRIALTKDWVIGQLEAQRSQAVAALSAGTIVDGSVYHRPGEAVPGEEPPPTWPDNKEPEDGVFVEGDQPPVLEAPPPEDRKPTAAPPTQDDPARLDRENKPGEGDDWSVFYPWAAKGGYASKAAFEVIKAHHPGATRKKMPTIPEAVGALLADEDFRTSGGESDDTPEDPIPASASEPELAE